MRTQEVLRRKMYVALEESLKEAQTNAGESQSTLIAERDALTAERDALLAKLTTLTVVHEEQSAEVVKMKQAILDATAAVHELEEDLQKEVTAYSELQVANDEMTKLLTELNAKLTVSNERVDEQSMQLFDLNAQYDALKFTHKDLLIELERCKGELAAHAAVAEMHRLELLRVATEKEEERSRRKGLRVYSDKAAVDAEKTEASSFGNEGDDSSNNTGAMQFSFDHFEKEPKNTAATATADSDKAAAVLKSHGKEPLTTHKAAVTGFGLLFLQDPSSLDQLLNTQSTEEQIRQLQSELAAARSELDALRQTLKDCQTDLTGKSKELASAKDTIQGLQTDLLHLSSGASDTNDEIWRLNDELSQLQQQLDERESELQRAQGELSLEKSDNAELQTKCNELEASLLIAATNNTDKDAQLSDLTSHIQELITENEKVTADLTATKTALTTLQTESTNTHNEHTATITDLTDLCAELQRRVAELSNELREQDDCTTELNTIISSLRSELHIRSTEITSLKSTIVTLQEHKIAVAEAKSEEIRRNGTVWPPAGAKLVTSATEAPANKQFINCNTFMPRAIIAEAAPIYMPKRNMPAKNENKIKNIASHTYVSVSAATNMQENSDLYMNSSDREVIERLRVLQSHLERKRTTFVTTTTSSSSSCVCYSASYNSSSGYSAVNIELCGKCGKPLAQHK